jgi:Ca2+-binding EF-hand superfamily protein
LIDIFKIVDEDGSGLITREEFVKASLNKKAGDMFYQVMKGVRKKNKL